MIGYLFTESYGLEMTIIQLINKGNNNNENKELAKLKLFAKNALFKSILAEETGGSFEKRINSES